MTDSGPWWTSLPFAVLVLALAVLPLVLPRLWARHGFQLAVTVLCAAPVVAYELATGHGAHLAQALGGYASFIATLGALYVTSGGIHLGGDLQATPRNNVCFLLAGALLASVVGTTGASMLLIRPFLRTNSERERRNHLVPFFILAVANAGGMLTPLGDPPLLLGYIEGVPFFWTLRLFPLWLLYVGLFALALYVIDGREYAREPARALAADRRHVVPLRVRGWHNALLLLAVIPAALLPRGVRELALIGIGALSFWSTPASLHRENRFGFGPILDVAIVFAGLFVCLGPIEVALARAAPSLPLQRSWQLFWGAGLLSSVLDNAPTYTAFTALARGLSQGRAGLVAGVSPLMLAAISAGSVVMGATTYLGNGPNWMVKAIAERERFPMPSFTRYALFAFAWMLPAHLVTTAAFWLLER